ncbi:MAG: tetratricopeptide repeat protein [Elusimicrobiota bacterium]
MKKILNIIFKPKKGVQEILETEPIFSGLFIFILSVIAGNFNLMKNIAEPGISIALYHIFIVILLWAGVLSIVNLLITGIIKMLTTFSSGILTGERFRKLFIAELYISVILILRPLFAIFISNKLAWIILFIWGVTLILLSIISLWNITEIKGALVLGTSLLIVFLGYRFIKEEREYIDDGDFKVFIEDIDKTLPAENVELLGFKNSDSENYDYKELVDTLDTFTDKYPESPVLPYALLIKGRIKHFKGEIKQAEKSYKKILKYDKLPSNIKNTVLLNLKDMLSKQEYMELPLSNTALKWKDNLRIMGFPQNFAYYRGNIRTVYTVNKFIDSRETFKSSTTLSAVISNIKGTEFEDDIHFKVAQKLTQKEDSAGAEEYFNKAIQSGTRASKNRIRVESVINYIEQRTGLDMLTEKFTPPFALLQKAKFLKEKGNTKEAAAAYRELLNRFSEHILGSEALMELAKIAEEEGEFKQAALHYRTLLSKYPLSHLRQKAVHKKILIDHNLDKPDLLYSYSRAWKKWQQEEYGEAIKIYRSLIEKFPDSEVAYELQFNIGKYYKNNGDYMEALSDFRAGYRKFKDTPRGFDFGCQVGEILHENLKYYRRAVNWYKALSKEYEAGYQSPLSGLENIDIMWTAADICKEKLRDYNEAKNIYYDVQERFNDPNIVARALYNIAWIDENIYNDYASAVGNYQKLTAEYADLEWGSKAKKELENIHNRGVRLLERYR